MEKPITISVLLMLRIAKRIAAKEKQMLAIKPETYSIKVVYCYRHVHDRGIETEQEKETTLASK